MSLPVCLSLLIRLKHIERIKLIFLITLVHKDELVTLGT